MTFLLRASQTGLALALCATLATLLWPQDAIA